MRRSGFLRWALLSRSEHTWRTKSGNLQNIFRQIAKTALEWGLDCMELQISNLPGRRVVFVDHVSKVLGGAEVNLIELLGSAGLSKRWQVVCACAPGSPLSAALGRIGVRQVAYSFSPSLNELRIVGSSFQFWRNLAGFWEVQRAAARLQTILRQ